MTVDASYEVTVLIGPCSEEDSEDFAESILDLPLAQAVHAAVAISRLNAAIERSGTP